MISRFVLSENFPAIRLYERLGFMRLRTVAGFTWKAHPRGRAPSMRGS